MSKVKKVMAIHRLNFCEIVEFEGSTDKKPDVLQIGKGQALQLRLQVGSTLDEKTGEWGNLLETLEPQADGQSGFSQGWDPVPPVDEQVLKAEAEAKAKLEAERAAAESAALEAATLALNAENADKKEEFVLP